MLEKLYRYWYRLFTTTYVGMARTVSNASQCSVDLDLRLAIPACCCSCFTQQLLADYSGLPWQLLALRWMLDRATL